MRNLIYTLLVVSISFLSENLTAQVGIDTATPTEIFDIKGSLRVRSLPLSGELNTIYTTGNNTESGTTPTQIFSGSKPTLTDTYGVIGQTKTADLVPNHTASNFVPDNDSAAMFVIKRYLLSDWPSGTGGIDTTMNTARWEAIQSNVEYKIDIPNAVDTPFDAGEAHGYRLKANAGGNWFIIGDIAHVTEESVIDILFINKNYTAAESRVN